MSDKKIALIGDVVASRRIKPRVDFDKRLVETLQVLNRHTPGLLSPYTITIGDEIQALFAQAGTLFHDALTILSAIYPQRMRFCFAVGELVTPVNPVQAIGMDGPAFHLARDGILDLKKQGDLFTVRGEIPNHALLNNVLALISHNLVKWNDTRLRVLVYIMEGKVVKQIADTLAVSEQAVYKNINAGALEQVAELLRQVEALLNSSLEG
jgi:hypothetical protein